MHTQPLNTHCFALHFLPSALLLATILPVPPPTSVCARAHAHVYAPITRDNQQLRLLRNERKTAARRTATQRDGAFEESLPTSE